MWSVTLKQKEHTQGRETFYYFFCTGSVTLHNNIYYMFKGQTHKLKNVLEVGKNVKIRRLKLLSHYKFYFMPGGTAFFSRKFLSSLYVWSKMKMFRSPEY